MKTVSEIMEDRSKSGGSVLLFRPRNVCGFDTPKDELRRKNREAAGSVQAFLEHQEAPRQSKAMIRRPVSMPQQSIARASILRDRSRS
jgi:hypothetical protein